MAGSTTRLGLVKPAGGSTGVIPGDDIVDIDVLNANFDKIDASIGAQFVTSATHPASPFGGEMAFESDTRNLLVYDSANTRFTPSGIPRAASDTVRGALYPSPQQGDLVMRTDRGCVEQYFGLYDVTTNPAGAKAAGWYAVGLSGPVGGTSTGKLFESAPANQTNLTPGAAELFPAGMVYSFTMPYASRVLLATTFFWTAGGNAAGHTKIRVGANGNATDELVNDRRTGNNAVSGGAIGESLSDVLFLPAGAQKLSAGLTSDGAGFGQAIQNLMYRISRI